MPRVKSFLYAVRMLIPNHDPQPIKVGFSTNPDKRKLSYNSGPYPCEWLGMWLGTIADELAFHVRFYKLNQGMSGEWFLPDDEFLKVITAKVCAYRRLVERQQQRAREREEARAQREAEEARVSKELRVRAATILEEYVQAATPSTDKFWESISENN